MNSIADNTTVIQNQEIDHVSSSNHGTVDRGGGNSGLMDGQLRVKVQSNHVELVPGETTSSSSINKPTPSSSLKDDDDRQGSDPELAKINGMKTGRTSESSATGEEVPLQYDSDGLAPNSGHRRSASPGSGSVGSSGTSNSNGSKTKRKSWKKPKDKPKRPLSSYNIFFKHERSRIVEGKTEEATPEETIRSIEIILSTSRETRRHRRTHGRITFGDLARRIADKWKAISPEQKALFDHYAGIDMRRYRKEVQLWKERKEYETMTGNRPDGSASYSDSISEYSESGIGGMNPGMGDQLGSGSAHSRPRQHDPWAPRKNFYENMSNSFSSVDSEFSMDPMPMQMMRQQQMSQQQNSQMNFHQSMPNLGGNFLRDKGMSMAGNVPDQNHSTMLLDMQQQVGFGALNGGGGYNFDQELTPMDFQNNRNNQNNQNTNDNMLLGTLNRDRQQQQQMMLQNQFEMGFQQQQQQERQMNAMHNSFSGRPSRRMHNRMRNSNTNGGYPDSVPMFVGSNNNNEQQAMAGSFQQLNNNNNNNSNRGFETPMRSDGTFSFHSVTSPDNGMDPVPFNEVFPDETINSGGKDLENYLSNLDLSHM